MKILKKLFGESTPIKETLYVPGLGELIWVEDEESWRGEYKDIEILLSYEKNTLEPSAELISYAVTILKNIDELELALEKEKVKFIEEWESFIEEVKALKYSSICFYRYKSKLNRIIASLEPGENYKEWRIEFSGTTCEGLGFDS